MISPDGKTLAYWSDKTGEYQLTLRSADGTGAERTVTRLGPGFRYHIFWSPDSTKIVFVDQAMNVNLCDVATGAVSRIDKGLYMFEEALEHFSASWSADSRWVSYGRDNPGRKSVIFLYDTKDKKLDQVTSGFYDDSEPAFDPDGKYLYYISGRTFEPSYGTDLTWIYANTDNIVAVPLRVDVPSPLAPRDDVEEGKKDEAKKDDGKNDSTKADKTKAAGFRPLARVTSGARIERLAPIYGMEIAAIPACVPGPAFHFVPVMVIRSHDVQPAGARRS